MTARIKYPIGIQSFPNVIEGGYVYVDKTMYIRELVTNIKYSFLSRPRRFGKSLFLSTLEAYFEGRRELFKGLDIDTDDMNWTPRPVIKISLNTIDPKSEDSLINYISSLFNEYELAYGILDKEKELSRRFEIILRTAYEYSGQKAAILIDEYDAPLLNTLDNDVLNKAYRETLRSIFSVLKNYDEYIHFAFVTGVSRFSHTSLFSGANNLKDISFNTRFSAICGITEDELHEYFLSGICEYADSADISESDVFALLKKNYDGYHFSKRLVDVYNPFSLLNALYDRDISNYWFQSGTPTYLLKVMRRNDFFLPELDCLESAESDLSVKESYMNNPVALLFESGYVTLKSYDDEKNTYMLGLPNEEVAISFAKLCEGMRQIRDKGYTLPYADEGRRIIKISANYSSKDNNIDSWVIE